MSALVALALCVLATVSTAAEEAAVTYGNRGPLVQHSLSVTGELFANTSGGIATGSRWNSLADLTLRMDLARVGGLANSSLTAQLLWIKNQHGSADFGDLTGAFNPSSGIQATDALRVFNLFYRQSWSEDRFEVKVGQLAIDGDFMVSDYAAFFALSTLGAMPAQVPTPHAGSMGGRTAFAEYAVASPAVHFSAQVNERTFVQLGIYYGGPGPGRSENHGFNWDRGRGQGIVVFSEAAYRFAFAGRKSTFRAGGFVHTGRFANFAALATNERTQDVRGLYNCYLMQDAVLAARNPECPIFAIFWRAVLSPQSDRSVIRSYADAGFNCFGPIRGRPADTLGVAVSYSAFNDNYRRLNPDLAASESALEASYRAKVTDHFSVQAIVQRLFKPRAAENRTRHTAQVVGLRAILSY